MRIPIRLAAALLLPSLLPAQRPDPLVWLQSHVGDPQRTGVVAMVAAARQAGVITDTASLRACKQAFRQWRGKDRRATAEWRRTDCLCRPTTAVAGPEAVVVEHEWNDSWSWADDLGIQFAGSGSNAVSGDLDTYKVTASGGDFFTFAVVGTGSAPIVDSTITVRSSQGQPVAFADLPGVETLSVYLPAGDYYVEVGSFRDPLQPGVSYGGSYDLQVNRRPLHTGQPQLLTTAGLAGTTQAPGNNDHDVFRFVLAADSTVDLRVGSNADTVLVVQRQDGAIWFVDDDSSLGIDARADLDLPAGTYYAYVTDFGMLGGVPFTLGLAVAARAVPELTAGAAGGVLLGDESLRLFRATLAQRQCLDVATNAGTAPAVGDTVLGVLDRNLAYLADGDDDDTVLHGHYSRVKVSLPAAAYGIDVGPYPGATGSFTVSATLSPFAAVAAATFGRNQLVIGPSAAMNTYLLANGTACAVRTRSSDYYYNVVGPTGLLANTLPGQDWYAQAVDLAAGEHCVLCFDRFAFGGPLTLDLLPALQVEAGRVVSRGKEGDFTALLIALGTPTPGINLGIGDRGLFLLPFVPSLLTLGLRQLPASGQLTWFTLPANTYGACLQAGDLHTGANWTPGPLGTWRNLLQL